MRIGRPVKGEFTTKMKLDLGIAARGERFARIDQAAVLAAYSRYANVYDLLFGAIFEPGRRAAVEAANTRPDQRILEVGVGTGLSLPRYRSDARVVGIDVSPEMLEKARTRVTRQGLSQVESLYEMDAERMRFPDDSFDAVVVMYTVSVVSDLERLFCEIRRVCIAGGDIVVVNHFASSGVFAGMIEKAMAPFSSTIGFRPNLKEAELARHAAMAIHEVRKVNVFGYWKLIRFRNGAAATA